MYFTKAGAVTALAGLGQAFLLPPTIHSADSEIVNTLPFEDAIAGEGMSLRLPCPGCPVVFKDTLGRDIATDIKNQLGLNFEVVHTPEDEEDKLVVNGLQLWPVGISASSIEPLTAPQFIYTDESTWDYAAEPQLGYSIFSQAPILSPDQELYLVKIQLEVIEVGNTFIKGIPAVEISLLRTPSGKLMLGDVMQMEAPAKELTPSDGDQECATALCKWRAILAEKLSSLKGCGRKPLKAPPRPNASVDGPKDHDSRPHRRPQKQTDLLHNSQKHHCAHPPSYCCRCCSRYRCQSCWYACWKSYRSHLACTLPSQPSSERCSPPGYHCRGK
jgi:predicted small lipoprotein YifL